MICVSPSHIQTSHVPSRRCGRESILVEIALLRALHSVRRPRRHEIVGFVRTVSGMPPLRSSGGRIELRMVPIADDGAVTRFAGGGAGGVVVVA